jgi:ubiquitin thioesterase OTU1
MIDVFDRKLNLGCPRACEAVAAVLADPARFSEVVLGKPTAEYAQWILGPDHWGGAIELSILCEHYKMVISCVCIQTLRVDHYGLDGGQEWTQRCLLVINHHLIVIILT